MVEKTKIELSHISDYGDDSVSRSYVNREDALKIVNDFFNRIEQKGGDHPK